MSWLIKARQTQIGKKCFILFGRIKVYLLFSFFWMQAFKVNALNKYGKTMLSYAAEWGNLEIVEFLVQKGADGNAANSDGSKPLHIAARYGRKDIVKFFLNRGVPADSCDNDEFSPLHYVALAPEHYISSDAIESYQEVVRFLVDSNADLNALNRKGCTPLLLAAKYLSIPIIELFIKFGANLDICNERGWTILHFAAMFGWPEILRIAVARFDFDLDSRTSNGKTPLLFAACNKHKDIVELLIKLGANVLYRDENECTVLHYSCEHGWIDIVKYLLNIGCDLNAKNIVGYPPILLAAKKSRSDIVEYLIKSGNFLDIECYGKLKKTVLHYACEKGWVDIVKSLIKKGSSLHCRDIQENTPLHCAVAAGSSEIIGHLLNAGAYWNLDNVFAETAFNKCISSFNFAGIVLFVENGAFFQLKDYNLIISDPLLKEAILQNVQLCTQAVINQFNNADLCGFYEIPGVAQKLPSMEKLKIASNTKVAKDIAESLKYEIQTKGYCNPVNSHPIALSMLCVKTFKIPL